MGHSIELALRQSVHRVVAALVIFLPGLVAFLLAIIVLAVIGSLLSALLRKALTAFRFDEKLAARQSSGSLTNIADWSPAHSPTQLISRTAWWLCLLAGIFIGIYAFDASFSGTGTVSVFFLPYVTHVVGTVVVLVVGILLARFLSRTVLIGAVNAQLQYARFLSQGVKWLVLVLTVAMALEHIGIGGAIIEVAFGILFGGIVLTLALAIGLGSRELVSRSIERTLTPFPDRPAAANTPPAAAPPPTTSTLRHF